MHLKLTEVLNIEISQGVITSTEEACDWVKGTFLYQRIQSHGLFYGKDKGVDLHSFILEKVSDAIAKLQKIRAITMEEDGTFSPDAACHVMSRNFVDFEAMKSIVKLPHDSGPVQLLHMMSNCEKIQTQVRRMEKKPLNEAYKLIKYKLEGPQSKVRIQTPAEKVFVMLQAAIGQHFFQDFALRQQMSTMIDGASQILSAVEQYAKEGSGHGQVATQGMLFRRSLYSSLWGENDGVLNQIGGVTQEMAAKLKDSGISTFADAVSSSDEAIASACNVTSSFPSSLRSAASKILQHTLKLSACIKEKDDGGIELYVKLERRVAGSEDTGRERVVSYSLLIFTDRAGGLLHYSEDITKDCEMKVLCPEKFGRAYVRLVSNLVGLDEQVMIDGNDRIQKSSFSLTPPQAKSSSKKGKKQSKLTQQPAASSRSKRSIDNHRNSVSNVSDLRLHKRGKVQQKEQDDDDCIIIDPDAVDFEVSQPSGMGGQRSSKKKNVTPSPHPPTKHQGSNDNVTPVRNTTSSSAQRSQTMTNLSQQPHSASSGRRSNNTWSKNTASNRTGPRNSRSSWFNEKRHQKTQQQVAFNSPKENPFASYSFDPNNIESSLASNAEQSSIIPSNLSNAALSTKKPRYGQSFRTPARTPATGNRRKSSAASHRISSVNLLQQKAAELQQQHSQMTAPRNYMNRGAMQQNILDAPSVQHNMGYSANNGHMMNQYGQSFHDSNSFMGPGAMSQGNYFQRPGTSAGSVMMQQSFGMAPEPSLSPPPPFMGRGTNSNMMTQNNSYMRARMSVSRPMSSAGQSIASQLRHRQTNYGGANMMSQQQQTFSGHFQPQNVFQHQPQVQQFEESFNQQGMSHQFDDTFNDPLCNGLDPTYGGEQQFDGGMNSFGEQQFDGAMNAFQEPSFGNPMAAHPQPQPQPRPQFGSGHQFGAGHQQQPVRNPYSQQPLNPYQQSQQQTVPAPNPYQQQFRGMPAANDNPPMKEVVVQNASVKSGLPGDDTSQFEDAFF